MIKILNKASKFILHSLVMILIPPFIRKKLMSCEQVASIISSPDKLADKESLYFKMHLLICQCCTNYQEQIKTIDNQAKKLNHIDLTPEQKQKLRSIQTNIIKNQKP